MQNIQNIDNEKLELLINEIEAFMSDEKVKREMKSIHRYSPFFFAGIIEDLKRVEAGHLTRMAMVDLHLSHQAKHSKWLFESHPQKIKEFIKNDCGLKKSQIMEIIGCYI